MRIWAGCLAIVVFLGGWCAAAELPLAERLIAAADETAAAAILAEVPGAVPQDVFTACTKAAYDATNHRHLHDAMRIFRIAMKIAERQNSDANRATSWNGFGMVSGRLRRYQEALGYYEKALGPAERSGDPIVMAHLLRLRGAAYSSLGRMGDAMVDWNRAMAIYREAKDRRGESYILASLCAGHRVLGDLRQAATECEASYRMSREFPDAPPIGLTNLGPVAAQQGNYQAARDYMEEAIRQFDRLGDVDRLANALLNISPMYRHLGENDKSLAAVNRALAITEKGDDTATRAMALFNRAGIYANTQRLDEALDDLKEGMRLQSQNDSPFETAQGLKTMAQVEGWMGRTEASCTHAAQALQIARQFRSTFMLANALNSVGVCEMKRDDLPRARAALEESVRHVETFRDMAGGSALDGQAMMAERIEPFRNLLAVLMEQRDYPAALDIAERTRARQLLDTVRRGRTQAVVSMSEGERQTERDLSEKVTGLARKMAEATEAARPAARKAWEEARREFDVFRGHLYASHPDLAASRGEAAPIRVAETAELLPDDRTVLIEFVSLRLTLYALVITRGADGRPAITMHRTPYGREALVRAVSRFREQLSAHDLGYRRAAAELYERILGPSAPELRGKTTLVIVPDGALWDLPFQAMVGPDGRHLVERVAIFYAPSLTFLRESRRRAAADAARGLLAVGNPASANLPNAAREVSLLARLYSGTGALALTGGEATKDAWLRDAPEYRVLHIATHGVLNPENPMYSWLSLSAKPKDPGAGALEAREILRLNLKADVAVLSACDTARGEVLPGEGLVGMSWAFLAAGTRTAVVSQWGVDSAGTTELMLGFHRNLRGALGRRQETSRAASLRQAVLELMKTPEYRHPYYWAGFVMIGNGF